MCLTLIWKEKMCLIYKFKVMERKIMVIVLLMAVYQRCTLKDYISYLLPT